MFTRELLGLFPRKRIRAVDGMAVTAEVWEEAHEYHRLLSRFHALLQHGAGIVAGLEVIAGEPADSTVYVLPGVAVDPIGQIIVIPEPRTYDLGPTGGTFYLVATYHESRPQGEGSRIQEDAPLYVRSQYTLEAVAELPATPHVELARIRRRETGAPIVNAADPDHPRAGEIDLRFRRSIGAPQTPILAVGVVTLRGAEGTRHGEGMAAVAAALRQTGVAQAWVDRGLTLSSDLARYDALYVVGSAALQFSQDEMKALYAYWQQGGTIIYESCRRNYSQGNPPADTIVNELLSSFGVRLEPLQPPGADAGAAQLGLWRKPHLFAQAPAGFETQGTPALRIGEGVLVSTYDYGCLWRGLRRDRPAQRGEIRDALEWGGNLLLWAAAESTRRRANFTTPPI